MKRIFIAVFAGVLLCGVLLCGILLAQETNTPASGSPAQEPQTPAAAPSTQQMPEPSTSQPPEPSTTQPQQTPAQQAPEPSTSQPQQAPPATTQPAPGQTPAAGNAAQTRVTRKIAPGSVIPVQLTKSIDAKKARTGDEVVAKVPQDMKTSNGEVLVPKDTKVVGHVTEAQPRTKEQKESQVAIAFDRAVMKNGGEVQLPMSIQAIIGQQNSNASSGNDQNPSGAASAPTASSGGNMAGGGSAKNSGGSTPPPTPSPSSGGTMPGDSQAGANAGAPITAQTQGVVGISNLRLSPAPNPAQGSVVSSDKNNVKLDSGMLLLLKVNQ